MVFNSLAFAIFLPTVLVIYYCLHYRAQTFLILLASYFFYGWWDWRFLSLLWLSTVVDYIVGRLLDDPNALDGAKHAPEDPEHAPPPAEPRPESSFTRLNRAVAHHRKIVLTVSVIANLALLAVFKYFNFFVESADAVLQQLGFHSSIETLWIILPVGISFFTFQSMSYTIDVYRGKIRAVKDPLNYAVFVAYFPQLVNGPIERADHMIRQYDNPRVVDRDKIYSGLMLMLIGFFKKIAIADSVAPLVDEAFTAAQYGSWSLLYKGVCLFAIQIYCDFSGYTDIARGTSKLLGIELMENFQQPYLSRNITEFWRRWHISLSTWLRDYLYIPLGGSRYGKFNTYRNLFLTMLLGGLWHGANSTFIIWGGLHGLYLAIHKMMLGEKKPVDEPWRPWHIVKLLVTLHLVLLAWIFFRPGPVRESFAYLKGILTLRGVGGAKFQLSAFSFMDAATVAFFAGLVLLIDIPQYRRNDHLAMLKWSWPMRGAVIALMLLLLLIMGENNDIPFIYFQF
ncbi:MAG: MBOAT family protein [Burkholderiales bacterium]|nr:MBOAT family protein [Phycisphaerae bacterium]